jgi:hypothetical protein
MVPLATVDLLVERQGATRVIAQATAHAHSARPRVPYLTPAHVTSRQCGGGSTDRKGVRRFGGSTQARPCRRVDEGSTKAGIQKSADRQMHRVIAGERASAIDERTKTTRECIDGRSQSARTAIHTRRLACERARAFYGA